MLTSIVISRWSKSRPDVYALGRTWHVLLAAEAAGLTPVIYFSGAQAFGIAEGERFPDYFPVDDAPPAEPYDASDSARQRLDRALQHLRSLGIRAAGEAATGDAYRLVRRRAGGGSYDRVLLVLTDRDSVLARLARHILEVRLRWVLRVPVQAVGHQEFALPVVPRQ